MKKEAMKTESRRSIWLPKFDRDADYVVTKPISLGHRTLYPGEDFDKTLVNARLHRIFYEQRMVRVKSNSNGSLPAQENKELKNAT